MTTTDQTLAHMCAAALVREASSQAIEFEEAWVCWGEMRQLADQLNALFDRSGVGDDTPIAFVPHNRPAAVAALLAMLARGCTVRMVYAFQSPAGIARDLDQLEPAIVVAAPRIGSDWIHTSDLAVVDRDGFLFHRGRADGAIIRGGFKLLPETIERALLLDPAVSCVAVVGLSDPRLGQVPAAAVQLRPGTPHPTPEELESHLREHVYATHIPVAWRIVNTLPRTPSLKVDNAAVRGLFENFG
jgi:acyl-CoA synthetase (AMP-forming)/AMP-acid ligase II